MHKTYIWFCFLSYLALLFFTTPSETQTTTTLTPPKKGVCNSTLMKKALIAEKKDMESIVDEFTPRSFLTEIKERNCTEFIGTLKVNSIGAQNRGHNEFVRQSDLENLRGLEVIHGGVEFDLSLYKGVTNLSFFASLKAIYGEPPSNSFSIRNSKLTFLFPPSYLIAVKNMSLINNKNLCYMENFTFSFNLKVEGNKDFNDCKRDGHVCYYGCHGCYGPDNGKCIYCSTTYWGYGFFQGQMTCKKCDPTCKSCKGPGKKSSVCECKVLDYRDMCVFKCPSETMKYYDQCRDCSSFGSSNPVYNVVTESGFKTCQFCDKNCFVGCSGSSSKDCLRCKKFKYFYDKSTKDKFECVTKCPGITGSHSRDPKTGDLVCGKTAMLPSAIVSVLMVISALASKLTLW